jgi:mannitol/fructose-specific phosphotransferase system IIA component (Ntr-type)
MKLTDIISKKAIIPSLKAKDKNGVVAELAAVMKKAYGDEKIVPADLARAILDREEVGSTGIHGGVAIPHAHVKALKEVRGAFGRAAHPVDFKSVDGEPTFLFFMIAAPQARNEQYLQALHRISAAIKGSHFCKFLRAAKTVKEIEDVLREAEEPAKV